MLLQSMALLQLRDQMELIQDLTVFTVQFVSMILLGSMIPMLMNTCKIM
jgi:hypothetical protein